MPTPVYIAAGLKKSFSGNPFAQNYVLRGIDLTVQQGAVVGLLGQNGSGKSTLLKCSLGLLRPSAGQVTVLDEDGWDLSAEAKSRIGYVPQEVVSYPWMLARQVIEYTAAFYPRWNQPLVDELCRRWRLPLEERVAALSTGQLQTLGIVLALGHEPELLILDEPVASLDPVARRQFLRTLLEIVADRRRTVIFSTHITSDLERVATRVAMLRDGVIGLDGELDELKDRVKRLHLAAAAPLPKDLAVPGALAVEIDGAEASITLANFDSSIVDQLRVAWNADVTVQDLNLEEMFIAVHEHCGGAAPSVANANNVKSAESDDSRNVPEIDCP